MGFFSSQPVFAPIALDGAVVVITGGARGIGRATAEAFVARGARVCIGDLGAELVTSVAAEIGSTVYPFQVDVTDKASFAAFLQAVEQRVGPIDILINNAGVMAAGPFLDEPDAKSRAMIEVNLWGPIQGMRLALPAMLARGRGHIVNVTSMAGKFPIPGAAVYAASKFGAVGLSMVVRDEVAHRGVSVSQVLPTAVRTDLIQGIPQGQGLPVVSPRTIARAIVASCASRKDVITVPDYLKWYDLMMALVPRSWMRALRTRIKADRMMTALDSKARAAYENRMLSHTAGNPSTNTQGHQP